MEVNNVSLRVDHTTIRGNRNVIYGNFNIITGDGNTIRGDGNYVEGNNNQINGDDNEAEGKGNRIITKQAERERSASLKRIEAEYRRIQLDMQLPFPPVKPTPSPLSGADEPAGAATACILCTENKACCATVPCGHMNFCIRCSQRLTQSPCPVCRSEVRQMIKVFT
jgi:hypothetical protein